MRNPRTVLLALAAVVLLALWWWVDSDTGPSGDDAGPATRATVSATTASSASSGASTSAATTSGSPTTSSAVPSTSSSAVDSVDPVSGLRWIDEVDLPPEAWDTLQLIDDGGPFPYDEDDGTFGNFEGILPSEPRGYYREYTVDTPGLSHRGARRIIAGEGGEYYYTQDHYASFERIRR